MEKKESRRLGVICFILAVCILIPNMLMVSIAAEIESDKSTQAGEDQNIGFSVRSILPESQINQKASYYHLKVLPGELQEIELEVSNTSREEQTFIITANNATTNSNGLIIYTKNDIETHESMKAPLESIATVLNSEIIVPAGGTEIVKIHLSIPVGGIEGIVLGGLEISQKEDGKVSEMGGMMIGNRYSYVIGIVLTQYEELLLSDILDLELLEIIPEITNGRKILGAQFLNPEAQVKEEFEIYGTIRKANSTAIVAERELENVRVAPNSIFPFQLDWGMQEVQAGTYIFEAEIRTGQGIQTFSKEFVIERQQAYELNEETVFRVILPNWWKWAVISLSIVTLFVVGCLIKRTIKHSIKEGED
jgi:Bacterial protein of unknown function (DUF916)./Protein of unknown function C-terminal (DUF3324).